MNILLAMNFVVHSFGITTYNAEMIIPVAKPQNIIRTNKDNIMPSHSTLRSHFRASYPLLTAINIVMRYEHLEIQGQDTSRLTEKMPQILYLFGVQTTSLQQPRQARSHLKDSIILLYTALNVCTDSRSILTQCPKEQPHLHNSTVSHLLRHHNLRHCTQTQ